MVIGTRPDCIDSKVVDLLSELSKDHLILLEFGVESTLNRTLDLVNRCHTYEETIAAFDLAKDRGLILGAHMIIGLPGESKEDILNHAKEISKLPITTLKLHQLQIIKHTVMALQLKKEPEKFKLFTADEYIDLVTDFISLLRPDIVIERFISESPQNLLLAPKWNGLKNFEITSMIDKNLIEKDLWQGKFYN